MYSSQGLASFPALEDGRHQSCVPVVSSHGARDAQQPIERFAKGALLCGSRLRILAFSHRILFRVLAVVRRCHPCRALCFPQPWAVSLDCKARRSSSATHGYCAALALSSLRQRNLRCRPASPLRRGPCFLQFGAGSLNASCRPSRYFDCRASGCRIPERVCGLPAIAGSSFDDRYFGGSVSGGRNACNLQCPQRPLIKRRRDRPQGDGSYRRAFIARVMCWHRIGGLALTRAYEAGPDLSC